MRFPTLLVIALAVAALAYLGFKWRDRAQIPETQSTFSESAVAERGAVLYREHCADCHGVSGMARGNAPDLRDFRDGEETFKTMVMEGFYPMPEFESVLSDDDRHALWVYITALRNDPSP